MVSAKHYKLRKIIGGLYVAFIIIMSLVPDPIMAKYDPTAQDVLSHFTAYFIMMLWYARIYPSKYYPNLAAIFILLGIGLECMQGTMETREFQAVDILFNSSGVLLAWLLARTGFATENSK